ncbi:BirA family biotin operon repressor/biotin-[acetyl-CoA-carboxylase] ligase [Agromyces ramosus]|uniref:biotin--[biotin carboxyl-carrier protein] ligase n=1 Tax=Agromyces ramosus TaxID=33879 RepID=A0A4Q7MMQ7_9MICO|nr:biotin--[acetyl-CoA-carboxylase] ligase [Agromyces ramosus]RZS67939.1 BirA family biotin operon repressor/biotin-[acetyl-CoA-carboxylase] ligase [Agromyces ramosus]
MDLPLSRAAVPRLEFLASTGSTNDDLRDAATGPEAAGWPHGSVIVTDDQTAGRGRLGRTWLAPTGKTLAISVLVRPELPGGAAFPPEGYGWIPLIAGAAMTEAVRRAVDAAASARRVETEDDETGGVEVELKWPNDVLVSGFKVCGILSELLPDTGSVVVGAGLNLTLDEHDLPTLASTSLLLVTGVQPDADAVLADYLGTFLGLLRAFSEHGADAAASGIADRVSGVCGTLGSEVRVELPGDRELLGVAERLDRDGRLVVRDRNGEAQSVAAGDVTHLRY